MDPHEPQRPAEPFGTPTGEPQPYGQPPYGQPPYGQQPYGQQPPAQGTNTMAILSLVFAFLFWPLGLVFGFIARGQIKRTGQGGSGLALAGIIISFLALALVVLVVVGGLAVRNGGTSTTGMAALTALVG